MYLVMPEEIVFRREYGFGLLSDPRNNRVLRINEAAADIFDILSYFPLTSEELLRILSFIHEDPLKKIDASLRQSIDQFRSMGLLKLTKSRTRRPSSKEILSLIKLHKGNLSKQEFLSMPQNVDFYVTLRCNQRCQFCYIDCDKRKHIKKEMSSDQVIQIVDMLEREKILALNLTGGEPFLRDDILEIIRYINKKNFICGITTNGTLLDEEKVRELSHLDKRKINVIVSIHGCQAETHDKLVDLHGAFENAISALSALKEFRINTSLATVVNQENFKEIRKIADIGYKFTIRNFLLYYLVKTGMATELMSGKELPPKGYNRIVRTISNEYGKLMNVIPVVNPLPQASEKELGIKSGEIMGEGGLFPRCTGAFSRMDILPDGKAIPCMSLPLTFSTEIVNNVSLKETWLSYFSRFRKRRLDKSGCKEKQCAYLSTCAGGCPAVSYERTGSINIPDPRCPVFFPKWWKL